MPEYLLYLGIPALALPISIFGLSRLFRAGTQDSPPPTDQTVAVSDTYQATVRPESSHLLHGAVIVNTKYGPNRELIIQTERNTAILTGVTGLSIQELMNG